MTIAHAWIRKLEVGQVVTRNGRAWLVISISGATATLSSDGEETTWTIPVQLRGQT